MGGQVAAEPATFNFRPKAFCHKVISALEQDVENDV